MRTIALTLSAATIALVVAAPALASGTKPASASPNCQNAGSFERWTGGLQKEAIAKGISPQVVKRRLGGLRARSGGDQARSQPERLLAILPPVFRPDDLGVALQERSGAAREAQRCCLPRSSATSACRRKCSPSFWGLESDFGAITGNFRLIRSLATLAYDCRRSDFFRDAARSTRCASCSAAIRPSKA